jgi:CheY-like chemotaxis protein
MRRLVLADDSKTIQKVVALLFEEEDFEVACFENGASALEHIRSRGADVVLADVSLPILDGYDLCREIKEDPRTALLPVILLAGTMEPLDEERASTVRNDGSLTKPFETSRLIRLVKDLVELPQEKDEPEPLPEDEAPVIPEALAPELPEEVLEKAPVEESMDTQSPAQILSYSGASEDGVILHLPVFLSSGRTYFQLSEEQCVPSLEVLNRVVDRPVRPQFTAGQLDALAEELMKRLPDTVRSILPELAKSVLKD